LIKIDNLTKVFSGHGKKVDAIKNVSLHIEKQDIYGIIGMSGAGKSTLLRCIGFLEEPTSGTIAIDGADTNSFKGKDLIAIRKEVGIIFQGYHLLMQKNVRKNVAFPLEISGLPKDEVSKRVDEILDFVGLSDKADSYPSQLSGGQKQRVAIARALVNNSKVLLCDEPTSALDSLTTSSILDLLKKIHKDIGVTIVIITHEIGVVEKICNKMAVLDKGELVEKGFVKDIFAKALKKWDWNPAQ
jgi:ABC-type metal ion transport system, ATPase component